MIGTTPPLADALARGANRFNMIRLLAALAVIVSHTVSQKQGLVYEPLEALTPYALGDHAVNVFFVLSGLLVAMSFERSARLQDYITARLLRIMPGLAVCSALLVLVIGPFVTTEPLPAYFTSAETWRYWFRAVFLFDDEASLPGVFANLPMDHAVNAPIWTLAYEMGAYLLLMAAGMAGVFRSSRKVMACAILILCAYVALELWRERPEQPDALDTSLRAAILYLCGVAAWHWRQGLRFHAPIALALALIVWLAHETPADLLVWLIATSYWTLWLGTLGMDRFSARFERLDLSYGTYLYGWPTGQFLMHLWPAIPLPLLTLLTALIALLLGLISWHWVESPALAWKKRR